MTQEDIIRMAREAGFPCIGDRPILASGEEAMIRFAALVAAASASVEREACAKVLDEMAEQMVADMEPSTAIAWVRNRAAAIAKATRETS